MIILVIMEGDDSDSEIVMMKFWPVIMKAIPEVVVMVMQIIMVVMGYDNGDNGGVEVAMAKFLLVIIEVMHKGCGGGDNAIGK